jgi:hypothetical protein
MTDNVVLNRASLLQRICLNLHPLNNGSSRRFVFCELQRTHARLKRGFDEAAFTPPEHLGIRVELLSLSSKNVPLLAAVDPWAETGE